MYIVTNAIIYINIRFRRGFMYLSLAWDFAGSYKKSGYRASSADALLFLWYTALES